MNSQWKKKLKTELAAKDRRCINVISRNNAFNEQLVIDIEHEASKKLSTTREKVAAAHREIETLKQENKLAFDEERVQHKASCKELVKLHAIAIQRKNDKLADMQEEVLGMYEMMYEMLNEVKDAKHSDKASSSSAETLQMKVSSLKKRVTKMTTMCNDLKDEIIDESNYCTELQEKVDEYEVVIDSMQREYAEKEDEYQSIIEYMDLYYKNVVEQLQPQCIMKHWVKNKTQGQ